MRATRVIMNHAPVKEYCLRFFLKESFCCPYVYYPIESRCHIHECRRYNNYWNPNRESFNHFIIFLEFNSRTFSSFLACCSLVLPFFLFSFLLFSYPCLLYVSSYSVATIVCHHAPYNKSLI